MGVTMSQPVEACTISTGSPYGAYIHIGVGSNVVCSSGLGNARASGCGTDNKQFPRLNLNEMVILLIINHNTDCALWFDTKEFPFVETDYRHKGWLSQSSGNPMWRMFFTEYSFNKILTWIMKSCLNVCCPANMQGNIITHKVCMPSKTFHTRNNYFCLFCWDACLI